MPGSVSPLVSDAENNNERGKEKLMASSIEFFNGLLKKLIKNKDLRLEMRYSALQKFDRYFAASGTGKKSSIY